MSKFQYMSASEINNAYRKMKEDKDNAVFIFTRYFGQNLKESSNDPVLLAGYQLHKTLRDQLGGRTVCPIYINEPHYEDIVKGSMLYNIKLDIDDELPSVLSYKNGELVEHYVYINGDDLYPLIKLIKSLWGGWK